MAKRGTEKNPVRFRAQTEERLGEIAAIPSLAWPAVKPSFGTNPKLEEMIRVPAAAARSIKNAVWGKKNADDRVVWIWRPADNAIDFFVCLSWLIFVCRVTLIFG